MKQCEAPNCTNNQWGGGFCAYHQYMRKKRGGDLFKQKPRKAIPKESAKRKVEHKRYSEIIKELWDELVANKQNYCFFCGEKMEKRDNFHHLRKRDGYYLEKEYLVPAHNKCHLDYHFMAIDKFMQKTWYAAFMMRLALKDPETHKKELKRQEKGQSNLEFTEE